MTNDIFRIFKAMTQQPQRQDALADQYRDLKRFASKLGMSDDIIEMIQYKIAVEQYKYDSTFGDDKFCGCGHPYHRHFDSYDNNRPVGCKYCSCYTFKLDKMEKGN